MCAGPAGSHLAHHDLGLRGGGEEREREPDLVVERLAARHRARRSAQDGRGEVLRARLARRARDADDRGAHARALVGRQREERAPPGPRRRRQGELIPDDRGPGRPLHRSRARRRRTRGRRRAPPAAPRRGRPAPHAPTVDRDPAHDDRTASGGSMCPPTAVATLASDRSFTRGPPSSPASSSARRGDRRTGASGRANSWPVSWPLPAISTTSPGPASCSAARIASPPVHLHDERVHRPNERREGLRDDRLGLLGPGVVARDDRQVRRRGRGRPHQRALAAIAVAPAAEHDDEHGRGPARARPGGRPEAVGRVRVVDEDGEWLTFLDRLQPPGHAGQPFDPRGDGAVIDPDPRAAVSAPRQLDTLNRPRAATSA